MDMKILNRSDIEKIIPHRDNMLLLDSAFNDNGTAKGMYKVRGDEWFLQGHFPNNPVVPGVILCEIMAQSACVLLGDKCGENVTPYFSGLNNVKFKNPVKPNDTIRTECVIKRTVGTFYFGSGKAYVGETLCAEADFSFALTQNDMG